MISTSLVGRRAACLLTLACALIAPAAAEAAPTWLTAQASPNLPDVNRNSQLVMSDSGAYAATWKMTSTADPATNARIVAVSKRPGEDPVEAIVSTPSMGSSSDNEHVAINEAGDAIVVFDAIAGDDPYRRIFAVYRGHGDSAWSAPQQISTATNETAGRPDVALDTAGNAVLTWTVSPFYTGAVKAVYRAANGTLSADDSLLLAGGGTAYGAYPHVALDNTGKATIAFNDDPSSGHDTLYRAERSAGAGSTFGAAQAFVVPADPQAKEFTDSKGMKVIADKSGDLVIAWVGREGSWDNTLYTTQRDALGAWGGVQTVATDGGGFYGWDVGLDDAGNALAVWGGAGSTGASRYDHLLGAWSAEGTFPAAGTIGVPQGLSLDVTGSGAAIATWFGGTTPNDISVARRSAGGSGMWTARAQVAAGGPTPGDFPRNSKPEVGLDDQGNAAVAWQHQENNTSSSVQQTRLFDNAAPTVGTVTVPPSVELGSPASFAGSFADRIGPVSVSWNFGDGGTGTGTSPSHTFTALGSKTVTITGTDAAGNAATATRTVNVVDTTAPTTTMTDKPTGTINTDPVVTFSGSDNATGALSYVCTLDGDPVTPCTSPKTLTGLADGLHTFTVAAKDPSNNVDASPETASFTIDKAAPVVTIDDAPSGPTNAATIDVSFSSVATDVDHYECAVDTGAFATCDSPKSLTGLADGDHTFKVKAIDLAGNASDVQTTAIAVDRTGPTTTWVTAPPAATNVKPLFFTINTSEVGEHTFQYRIDGASTWTTATSGSISIPGLNAEKSWTIDVRTLDALGNPGATITKTVATDYTAPAGLAITAPTADATSTGAKVTIGGTAGTASTDRASVSLTVVPADDAQAPAVLEAAVPVSGGAWSAQTGNLPNGRYTAIAVQYDDALNSSFKTVQFTVAVPATKTNDAPKADTGTGTAPATTPKPTTTLPPVLDPVVEARKAATVSTTLVTGTLQRAGLEELAKPSIVVPATVPGPGDIVVKGEATVPTGSAARAAKSKRVVVFIGRKTVTAAGRVKVRVKLTSAGRKLVRRAKRLSITVSTAFTPKGAKKAETSSRKVTLKAKKKKRR